MTTEVPLDELYPDERNRMIILWAELQRKYGERPDQLITLQALKREAEDRFPKEVGLDVVVEVDNYQLDLDTGSWLNTPVITVIGRSSGDNTFDFERAQKETQAGFADGRPGVIMPDGSIREPKKNL